MTRLITVPPAEAVHTLDAWFATWLNTMRVGPAKSGAAQTTTHAADAYDERGAIVGLQHTRDLRYERVGDWKLGGNYDIPFGGPDGTADAAPSIDVDGIGHAPNGDLFCAVRDGTRSPTNEVWLFDHERHALTVPLAESIAAFAYMAALDARLAAGQPPFEPDAALSAKADELDDDAYDALYRDAEAAAEAAWEAETARAFGVLTGRVSPPWMFMAMRRALPHGFVHYDSTSAAARILAPK